MSATHGVPPFHCAAFAITSRQTSRQAGDERWRVDPSGLDWPELFAIPQTQRDYDEATFTQLATQSGWRLTHIVPAGKNQRRLHYERPRTGPTGT